MDSTAVVLGVRVDVVRQSPAVRRLDELDAALFRPRPAHELDVRADDRIVKALAQVEQLLVWFRRNSGPRRQNGLAGGASMEAGTTRQD